MSLSILVANILTVVAFFLHAVVGDKELRIINQISSGDHKDRKQEIWTMARCGWHWISIDLLFASIQQAHETKPFGWGNAFLLF